MFSSPHPWEFIQYFQAAAQHCISSVKNQVSIQSSLQTASPQESCSQSTGDQKCDFFSYHIFQVLLSLFQTNSSNSWELLHSFLRPLLSPSASCFTAFWLVIGSGILIWICGCHCFNLIVGFMCSTEFQFSFLFVYSYQQRPIYCCSATTARDNGL